MDPQHGWDPIFQAILYQSYQSYQQDSFKTNTFYLSKIQCIVPDIINTPETPNHPSVYSILASHFPLRILALRRGCQWDIAVVSKQLKKH